jgi:hypothetical protein
MQQTLPEEAVFAAMREALQAALQSHVRLGKAYRCDCSLCVQIRHALETTAGADFADRIREECAQVADWKAAQCGKQLNDTSSQVDALRAAHKTATEIADRIRVLKTRQF